MKTFIVFFILFACLILLAASEAYAKGHANAFGVFPPSAGVKYGKSGPQHFLFGTKFVFHIGHKKL